jgi:hypothetical protein
MLSPTSTCSRRYSPTCARRVLLSPCGPNEVARFVRDPLPARDAPRGRPRGRASLPRSRMLHACVTAPWLPSAKPLHSRLPLTVNLRCSARRSRWSNGRVRTPISAVPGIPPLAATICCGSRPRSHARRPSAARWCGPRRHAPGSRASSCRRRRPAGWPSR